jgi:hypothetical protein
VLLEPRPFLLEVLLHRLLVINRIEVQVLVIRHDEDEVRLAARLGDVGPVYSMLGRAANNSSGARRRKQQGLTGRHLQFAEDRRLGNGCHEVLYLIFNFRLGCDFEDVDIRTPLLLRQHPFPWRAPKNSQLNFNSGRKAGVEMTLWV